MLCSGEERVRERRDVTCGDDAGRGEARAVAAHPVLERQSGRGEPLGRRRHPDPGDDHVRSDHGPVVEPYALVVPRNDADFRLAVNRALVGLYRSGEIDGIFQRWLGSIGQPSPLLHAMIYLNMLSE